MSEQRPEDESKSGTQSTEPVAPPIEAQVAKTKGKEATSSLRGKNTLRSFVFIVGVIVVVGGFLLISHANKNGDIAQNQGKVALSDTELRDLVLSKHLTVYWAGPMAGAKYTLTAVTPGIVYVKYLPGGVGLNDTKTSFRTIGTYIQKNAFKVAQNAGAAPGNVGFLNADGNAVLYSSSRTSNVYIGIKGKDIQVEVFDPVENQALGLVLIRNQIHQIV